MFVKVPKQRSVLSDRGLTIRRSLLSVLSVDILSVRAELPLSSGGSPGTEGTEALASGELGRLQLALSPPCARGTHTGERPVIIRDGNAFSALPPHGPHLKFTPGTNLMSVFRVGKPFIPALTRLIVREFTAERKHRCKECGKASGDGHTPSSKGELALERNLATVLSAQSPWCTISPAFDI